MFILVIPANEDGNPSGEMVIEEPAVEQARGEPSCPASDTNLQVPTACV